MKRTPLEMTLALAALVCVLLFMLAGLCLTPGCLPADTFSALVRPEGEAGWTASTNIAPPLVRVIGD